MSASKLQRAKLQSSRLLADVCRGNYPREKSKKLWKNRGKTKYLSYELSGFYRLVVVMREGLVVFKWMGSHEAYNSLLPKLRRRRF